MIINLGPLLSDSNTGGFTRNIPDHKSIILAHDHCQVYGHRFEGVHFVPVLERVLEILKKQPKMYVGTIPALRDDINVSEPCTKSTKMPSADLLEQGISISPKPSEPIVQSYLWRRLGDFLRPNDIVLAEAGTSQFGIPDTRFPMNTSYITQLFWSSIGYTVGACLGACIAARELGIPRRVILFVGEGSLQMTVQEIGSYIRFGLTPIIFVINNNGYSIERAINGPEQDYNDISMLWDHQALLSTLGARLDTGIKQRSYTCRTIGQLTTLLDNDEFSRADCIQVSGPRVTSSLPRLASLATKAANS